MRPAGENALPPDAFYFSNRNKNWANDSEPTDAQPASPQPASPQPASAQPVSAQPRSSQPVVVPYAGFQPARLFADDVLHKVEVEVTETGTVASAATAITISRDGSNHVMRFNRPFIFFIRHRDTKLILFYGSVVRPMPEWIVPGVDVTKLPQPKPPGQPHRQPPPQQGPQAAGSSAGQAGQAGPGRRRMQQQPASWPAGTTPRPANG
ncbi:hypothetical protein FOCC_FOCC004292 [Frankliniella occidentalis]|nr:hypothetical protein FOCC_FOCC004292 [Frankliniella occidentalis]